MSDIFVEKPNGKIFFGYDFLYLMRAMELPEPEQNPDKYDEIIDAAMKLFLLQWDFNLNEIDASNELFWDKVKTKSLDTDLFTVLDRIIKFIKNDRTAQERLIIEMSAIADLNKSVSVNEIRCLKILQEKLDFRPSELEKLYSKGTDWSAAINYLGNEYIKSGIPQE